MADVSGEMRWGVSSHSLLGSGLTLGLGCLRFSMNSI